MYKNYLFKIRKNEEIIKCYEEEYCTFKTINALPIAIEKKTIAR